jgi:hypothetical protein
VVPADGQEVQGSGEAAHGHRLGDARERQADPDDHRRGPRQERGARMGS